MNTDDIPTPLTDAAIIEIECDDSCCDIYQRTQDGSAHEGDVCCAKVARRLERDRHRLREALEKQACLTAYYNGHSNGYKAHPNGGLFWENYLCPEARAILDETKQQEASA